MPIFWAKQDGWQLNTERKREIFRPLDEGPVITTKFVRVENQKIGIIEAACPFPAQNLKKLIEAIYSKEELMKNGEETIIAEDFISKGDRFIKRFDEIGIAIGIDEKFKTEEKEKAERYLKLCAKIIRKKVYEISKALQPHEHNIFWMKRPLIHKVSHVIKRIIKKTTPYLEEPLKKALTERSLILFVLTLSSGTIINLFPNLEKFFTGKHKEGAIILTAFVIGVVLEGVIDSVKKFNRKADILREQKNIKEKKIAEIGRIGERLQDKFYPTQA